MSREIKFRVWDKARKVWTSPLLGMTTGNIHFDWSDRTLINGQVDIMQFTGLKDKNGVEIYEGDIARMDDGSSDTYGVVWDDKIMGWALDGRYGGMRPWLADYAPDLTVIGNIYENPELLK